MICLFSPVQDGNSKFKKTDIGFQFGHNCLVFKSSLLLNGKSEDPSHVLWWEEAAHRTSHHRLPVPPSRVLTEHSLPLELPWITWKSLQVFAGLQYLNMKWDRRAFLAWLCLEFFNFPNLQWFILLIFIILMNITLKILSVSSISQILNNLRRRWKQ